MNAPVQCVRKKGKTISVSDDFISAVKKICNLRKAELLPDDSFFELFIGSDILDSMETSDSQIIWGRRGTGKTHLLKAFTQKVNFDPNNKSIAYYISCDNISFDSPIDIDSLSDDEKMKRYARNTFICFLSNLIEQMIDNYEVLLNCKEFYKAFDNDQKKVLRDDVDTQLCDLLENCDYGIPTVVSKEQTIVETDTTEHKRETNIETGIEGELSTKPSFFASLMARFGHKRKKAKQQKSSEEVKTTKRYSFSFSETKRILERLLSALNIDILYICIDELWLIDQKRELSIQPLFLDYIRLTLLTSNKISIKIASIREVTRLNSKATASNNYGLQSGHDIMELLNLDTKFITKDERINHYKNLLLKRIDYFSNCTKNDISEENHYEISYIVDAIFKSEANLDSLIKLTHIIPRNFLLVLQRALVIIKYDLQHYFVYQYLIREVVIKTYVEDKRSAIPMNKDCLFDRISDYINMTQHYFFILSSDQVKRFRKEIDNLIYLEIIHQIPSSSLPIKIMDRYKGFYIDSGKYLHTLQSSGVKLDNGNIYDFNFALPRFY